MGGWAVGQLDSHNDYTQLDAVKAGRQSHSQTDRQLDSWTRQLDTWTIRQLDSETDRPLDQTQLDTVKTVRHS